MYDPEPNTGRSKERVDMIQGCTTGEKKGGQYPDARNVVKIE
jgi:hypothetical protein